MKKLTFTLLAIIVFISACEYESDNINYKNIDPPQEIQIGIDLAGVLPDDTIYIYTNTQLYYSIDTQGKRLINQEFILDGALVSQSNNMINIYQVNLDNNVHKLKVKMDLKTNSGSLSEILGYERYIGEVTYNLKFVKGVDMKLSIRQEKTTEGNLKLIWNKPNLKQTSVDRYEISYLNNLTLTWEVVNISDVNETYFLDKGYTYGAKTYKISTYFKNDRINRWEDYHTVQYDALTEEEVVMTEVSFDKVRLSWTKFPYNCKLVLKWVNGETLYIPGSATSIEVSQPKFTEYQSYGFYVLPVEVDYKNYEKYPQISFTYRTPYFEYTPFSLTYNAKENIFYGLGHYGGASNIYKYDGTSMKLTQTFGVSDIHTGNKVVCSSKNGRLAYNDSKGNIHIVTNNNFSNQTTIQSSSNDVLSISDDDKLIIGYSSFTSPLSISIYNAATGSILYSLPGVEKSSTFGMSADGRYAYSFAYPDELKVFELKANMPELVYIGSIPIEWAAKFIFNPINTSQLIVSSKNVEFYMLDIVNKTKSATIKGSFQSIDPVTGNILYKDENYLTESDYKVHIRDNKLSKILLTQPINSINPHSDFLLINNILIKDASYRNLTKYLKP